MTEISKPDFAYIWANTGDVRTPATAKINEGWTSEVPPFQWENFAQNRQDRAIVHLFQKGISVWSPTEDYYYTSGGTKSYVQGSNGVIYSAVQSSTGVDPTTDGTSTYWRVAFATAGGTYSTGDTGTPNIYIVAFANPLSSLLDGTVLSFKANSSNTGPSTFKPDTLATKPILGLGLSALQGGEIVAGEFQQLVFSLIHDSWILLTNAGGGKQLSRPTQSQHAATLSYLTTGPITYYMGQI